MLYFLGPYCESAPMLVNTTLKKQNIKIGGSAEYSCPLGYFFKDNNWKNFITCSKNISTGEVYWEGQDDIYCKELYCGIPLEGNVINNPKDQYNVGEEIHFRCNQSDIDGIVKCIYQKEKMKAHWIYKRNCNGIFIN